jgi:DNA mismatch repair protein MutL
MPIKVLPPDLSARIAAGEVVERPVSVVKELLENSIDAGASQITVETRAGGVELVRIVDDGSGIPADELPLAFHRHATSKLTSAEQLDRVATLGFRGEALPSIAAVSRIAVQTRPHEETAGFRLGLEWGEATDSGSEGCAPGTIVEVSDLFGNQPARRKFLRSAQAETARVQELVSRYALAFPEIRFRLVNDGRVSLNTPGNGQPREALLAVYGSQVAENMLEVHAEDPESGYVVEGFAAAPSVSRANRTYLTLFVNRRLIQSRMLSFAVEEAYAGLMQVKRYPVAAINVVLPYDEVDVNSHPAKREVRFHQENRVFSLVQRAVRSALMSESPVPTATQVSSGQAPFSPFGSRRGGYDGSRAAFRGYSGGRDDDRQPADVSGGEALSLLGRPSVPLKVVGQLQLTYIVSEGSEGMYLVDQHAAHERVVFDRICQRREGQGTASQPLLAPVSVDLTPSHATTLQDNLNAITAYGFQVEPFGERSYLLRAVPVVLTADDPGKALIDILDLATLEGLTRQKEDIMAASIACHAAIRAGQAMTEPEMSALLEQLEATPNPHTCPHGRPTMVHFSSYHVEREFGRR